MRVLVVYSRVGGGHLSAARALAAELAATGEHQAKLVDVYLDCGTFPVTRFPDLYAWLARSHPHLWSAVYHGTARRDPTAVLRAFLEPGLGRLVRQYAPDVIVSVLPAINGVLADAATRAGVPLEVVLTDWCHVHPLWHARGVHHYTAPTEAARDELAGFGAAPEAVDVVGVPVRREFAARREQVAPRETITILAMVGAEGSPRAFQSIGHLAQTRLNAHLVVICGRNHVLRRRVEQLRAHMPLTAMGFVENIAELMRTADVLVTKAGGVTLAEAFCCGVPVVIHDVLPGQEAGNLQYTLHHGAVLHAKGPSALVRIVSDLAVHPVKRAHLAEAGARLARPYAAREIAERVIERAAKRV